MSTNTTSDVSGQLDNQYWQEGIFIHWSLALILGLPILLLLTSLSVYICSQYPSSKKQRKRSSSRLLSSLKKGLRIETCPLDVFDILEEKIQQNNNTAYNSTSTKPPRKDRKIHPKSNITEQDIRKVYQRGTADDLEGDDIVLFYRLASIFVSSGMSTIENEEYLVDCCKALGLPPISLLNLGLREITAQFQLGPVINISCATGDFYQLSLLSRTQQLVKIIISTSKQSREEEEEEVVVNASLHEENTNEEDTTPTCTVRGKSVVLERPSFRSSCRSIPSRVYLEVLDELEDQANEPYGWLVHLIAIYVVSTFAPVVVYGGDQMTLEKAAIMSTPIVIEVFLLKQYFSSSYGVWETPLVSFTAGLLAPIFWQSLTLEEDLEQCRANYLIGVLLIWFPGSSLVYGAHEVIFGSYYNGSSRLVKGILSALIIALFYCVRYWGRNWWTDWYNPEATPWFGDVSQQSLDTTGAISSLPPSLDCTDPREVDWYWGSVIFAAPFNLCSLVIFNVRLRDVLGVFLVAQGTYLIQGLLRQCESNTCELPSYINILIVAFCGGVFAEVNQILTGFSKYSSMLAIIFVLAPGAGAVRSILGAFRRQEGDFQSNTNSLWENVAFEGTTYAMGFYIAFLAFKPFHHVIGKYTNQPICKRSMNRRRKRDNVVESNDVAVESRHDVDINDSSDDN